MAERSYSVPGCVSEAADVGICGEDSGRGRVVGGSRCGRVAGGLRRRWVAARVGREWVAAQGHFRGLSGALLILKEFAIRYTWGQLMHARRSGARCLVRPLS